MRPFVAEMMYRNPPYEGWRVRDTRTGRSIMDRDGETGFDAEAKAQAFAAGLNDGTIEGWDPDNGERVCAP